MSGYSHKVLTEEGVVALAEWLGKDGCDFFMSMILEHNEIAAVFNEGGLPHAVHFREGMQVRNFMRGLPEFKDALEGIEFDDIWVDAVVQAMRYHFGEEYEKKIGSRIE